jgi:hypothetical protein
MKSASLNLRQPGVIRIDFSPAFQSRNDILTCILAFGTVIPPEAREFWLPQGEMAQEAFAEEVEQAWARLTPGQAAAVMDGRFKLRAVRTPRAHTRRDQHFDFEGEVVEDVIIDQKEVSHGQG